MKISKILPFSLGAAAFALIVGSAAGPSYAWQWGGAGDSGEEFTPQHGNEIVEYGGHWGANWRAEVLESKKAYAQKQGSGKQTPVAEPTNRQDNNQQRTPNS
jgi:hypothetical protein